MRKTLSILLLAALLVTLAVPASATKKDNQHQMAEVDSLSDGAEEGYVNAAEHLKGQKLLDALSACEEDFPEGVKVNRLTMIRQRDITSDTFPIEISFHTWGLERDLLVFFREEGEEEWELVATDKGNYVSASFPCNGQYALLWSW